MKKLFSFVAALIVGSVIANAADIKVNVPKVVALGEQFNISFVIEGDSKITDFSWNVGDGFAIVWGPQQGSSTSITMINGKTTKIVTKTYNYILQATEKGKFTIPAAVATIKGGELRSAALTIEVVDGGSSQNSSASSSATGQSNAQRTSRGTEIRDDDLYMKMSFSRSSIVVGEPVNVTIKLYNSGVNLTNLEDVKLPSFNGFWSQDVTPEGNIQFERENVDGRIMNAAVIKKYILIPQKAGDIPVDGCEMVCRVDIRRSVGSGSIFDGFFDDYVTVRKRVSTEPVTLKVKALPAGAPKSFYGGVGKFAVSAKLSSDKLKAHEASSLILTVSGKGNLSLLETPKVSFPADFETYDVKTQENLSRNSGGISGEKTYEFPFIPRSHGEFVIEGIPYTYYDINKGEYVTITTDPIEIEVERGTEMVSSTVGGGAIVSKKGVKNLSSDIRFIYTKPDALKSGASFFVLSGGFWALLAAMIAAAGGIWFALRKWAARKADVVGAKGRKATKMAMARLRGAESYLSQNLQSAFYEELHKALLGFVGDKFNMNMMDMSKDKIAERLEKGGVDASLRADFIDLLDACEMARYSPSSDHSALQNHYDKALATISGIDSSMKHSSSKAARIVTAAIMVLGISATASQDLNARTSFADSLFNAACTSYTNGNWDEALDDFQKLYDAGFESAELEYDMGNAYFKTGNYGKSILHYERCLKIDPSHEDARYNLGIVREYTLDDIDSVPEFVLKTALRNFSYKLSSNGWITLFFILFALTLGGILTYLLAGSSAARKSGFFGAIAAALLACAALGFSISQKNAYQNADSAIVLRAVSTVKSSPSNDASNDLFVLHEGVKVEVLDMVGAWTSIKIADGRKGWILSRDIEII